MNLANVQNVTVALESEMVAKLSLAQYFVIQAEQNSTVPAFPYASFKVLKYRFLEEYQHGVSFLPVVGDPTKITRRETRLEEAIVALSFYSDNYSQCFSTAKTAFDFLNSDAGKSIAQTDGCGIRILTPEIEDTTMLNISLGVYELQFGFNFSLSGLVSMDTVIDAIDTDATLGVMGNAIV